MRRLPLAASFAAFAAACAVGPDYAPPDVHPPTTYGADLARTTTAPEAPPKPEAEPEPAPIPPLDLACWWRAFNDGTLDHLVERALVGNRDLAAAQARVLTARALRNVTTAAYLPEVNASGSATEHRRSENVAGGANPFVPRESTLYEAGFDASWELDLFGHVRRGVEAADADLSAVEEERRDVALTLVAEVARNYVDLRSAQLERTVAEENLTSQRDGLALAESRFNAGLVSELDVAQARGQVATLEATLPQFQRAEDEARHRLAVLLGADDGAIAGELAASVAPPLPPPTVPLGLPSELLTRRPDLRRAERILAGATARIGVATSDLYPRFFLNGDVGLQSEHASDLFKSGSGAWSFGPGFSWPIFVGGRIRQAIAAQDARTQEVLANYEGAVVAAVVEVEDGLSAVERARARRAALAAAVAANRRSETLARDLYAQGLVDWQRVLDAQRFVFVSEDAAVVAQHDELTGVIALCKALGGGWLVAPAAQAAAR